MPRMTLLDLKGWLLSTVAALFLATGGQGQSPTLAPAPTPRAIPTPAPAPVRELPGAGRPVDIEATKARRSALAERIGEGVVIVPAAHARDIEVDVLQDNDFRQDDYFFYLTGIEAPDAWLLIAATGSGESESHLFLPPRDPSQEQWTGRKLGSGPDAERLTGIENVHSIESLDSTFDDLRARAPEAHYAVMYAGTRDNERLATWARGGLELRNIVPALDSARLVKDAAEMTRLRRAIDITVEAQRAAMRAIRPEMFEYEIEAVIEYTFRALGADRVGFPSIVGSGPNSTTLHYDTNRRQTQSGDLVVIDIGAEYGQYSADVTRTVPLSGRYTSRQREIYELVLGAQQAAIDATRPGVTIGQLTRIARQHIEDNSGSLCGTDSCNRYFIHGLSHWLGMRVHDVGDYSTPLAPGMVFTIEPGIYIEAEELGVRIEDDVLVTDTGAEILSGHAPRTVEDIEALMGDRPAS